MSEVLAIRYGSLQARKSNLFYRYSSYGDADAEAEMAYYFWLLRDAGRTVLIDTGFEPQAGRSRGRTCLVEPLAALAALGVEPADVSTVVITHFHYDHIGNIGAFENAEVVVPRTELEFWSGPLAAREQYAEHTDQAAVALIEGLADQGRLRTTDGEEEVLPGVTAIRVGGHSPGQTVIVVAGEDGDVVLASDAIHFYEEFELDRPFGVVDDLAAMYRAYDLLRDLEGAPGAVLVPGHDPAVATKFPATAEPGQMATRITGGKR
jgi:glyoxylase-like metal-dependent hydrolase (beta-lactamase superfamily II)